MLLIQDALKSRAFNRVTGRAQPSLAPPTANAFDTAPWFSILEDGTASGRDRGLAAGALYFGHQIHSLRKNLLRPAIDRLGGDTLLRLAIAQANRAILIARKRIAKAQAVAKPDTDGFLDTQALARIGGSRLQPNMTADELITTIVDTVPHWLFHVADRANTDDSGPILLGEVGAKIEQILSVEHGLRTLWLSILWEDRRLTWQGDQARLVLGHLDADTRWAAWEFRQMELGFQEIMADAAAARRGDLPKTPAAIVARSAVGLQRSGRTVRIKLGPATPASRRRQNVKMRVLEESYLAIFLDEPIPIGDQVITPRLLMKALCVVGDVCELLFSECRRAEIKSESDLTALSLPVSRNALKFALRGALEIDDLLVEAVLGQLTTETSDVASAFNEGVWHRPLFALRGGDKLFLLAAAVLSSMPTRQVERWLVAGGRADGLSKGSRGVVYEAKVRQTLAAAASQNKLMTDISVGQAALKRGKSGEEIDLLVRVGKTVIVGEIKCLLVPSESIEQYNHLGKLEAAARQASRKASWLRANRDVVRSQLSGLPDCLEGLTIMPIVVLNNGVGLGAVYNDVVITDLTTLVLYLSEGKYSHAQLIGLQGEFVPQMQILYRSQAEGEERLFDTLANPPSLAKWIRGVRWREDKFPVSEGILTIPVPELDSSAMRSKEAVHIAAMLTSAHHSLSRKQS